MTDEKNSNYMLLGILGIVAIVAIVGLLGLFMNRGTAMPMMYAQKTTTATGTLNTATQLPPTLKTSQGNVAGQQTAEEASFFDYCNNKFEELSGFRNICIERNQGAAPRTAEICWEVYNEGVCNFIYTCRQYMDSNVNPSDWGCSFKDDASFQ